jgi:hypothetical protein
MFESFWNAKKIRKNPKKEGKLHRVAFKFCFCKLSSFHLLFFFNPSVVFHQPLGCIWSTPRLYSINPSVVFHQPLGCIPSTPRLYSINPSVVSHQPLGCIPSTPRLYSINPSVVFHQPFGCIPSTPRLYLIKSSSNCLFCVFILINNRFEVLLLFQVPTGIQVLLDFQVFLALCLARASLRSALA